MRQYGHVRLIALTTVLTICAVGVLFFLLQGENTSAPVTSEPIARTEKPEPEATLPPRREAFAAPPSAQRVPPPEPRDYNFQAYFVVLAHDGTAVSGAEIQFEPVRQGLRAEEVQAAAPSAVFTDAAGEGLQRFDTKGPYAAVCRSGNMAGYGRFGFERNPVVRLTLVLKPSSEVKGRTVDTLGHGVANVSVTWQRGEVVTDATVSDAGGYFHFDRPISARCILRGEVEGYATAVLDPIVTGPDVKLVMTRGAQLVATVLEQSSRTPVRDFTLEMRGAWDSGLPAYTGTTDLASIVRIDGITPGIYQLRSGDARRVLVPADKAISVESGQPTRVELQIADTGSVEGLVLDGESHLGVPNAIILARPADAPMFDSGRVATGADGSFALHGLPSGKCSIYLTGVPPQYSQAQEFAVVQAKSVRVEAGETVHGPTFTLRAGAFLWGRVTFKDGSPAPGATVSGKLPVPDRPDVVSWMADTVADADGRFTIYQVPDGAVTIWAQLRGRESGPFGPVVVGSGAASDIVLTLGDAATGRLAGRVFDKTGSPLRAHVQAVALETSTQFPQILTYSTDDDGYFLLTDVAAGTYEIHFGPSKTGLVEYIDSDGPVTLGPGQIVNNIRLQLSPGGLGISGVVRKSNGETVPSYVIEVEGIGAEDVYEPFTVTETDEHGQFQIENLAEGTYRLYPYNSRSERWRMEAQAGDTLEVVLPDPAKTEDLVPPTP